MGTPYKCIEGEVLGQLGGVWCASYAAYDVNLRCIGQIGHPPQQHYWNNRLRALQSSIARFSTTQLWVLMPNGVVDKTSLTIQARNRLIRRGGVSIHAYWALWMLHHCSASNIAKNTIGVSCTLFRALLQGSLPFL